MNEQEKGLTQVVAAYQAAVWAKDVDGLVALYDPEVRVFDAWGAWSYKGREAWRHVVTDWFAGLGTERVVVEVEEAQIVVGQEVAVVHAFVAYQAVSAEGEPLRAMHNRLTWGLRAAEGSWKIVHEHTSAPADFETSKVILQRR